MNDLSSKWFYPRIRPATCPGCKKAIEWWTSSKTGRTLPFNAADLSPHWENCNRAGFPPFRDPADIRADLESRGYYRLRTTDCSYCRRQLEWWKKDARSKARPFNKSDMRPHWKDCKFAYKNEAPDTMGYIDRHDVFGLKSYPAEKPKNRKLFE